MYGPGPLEEGQKQKDYSKTGTVATDAKYIDASETDNYKVGHAIIRKGEEFAIIDKNGEFVVPFGKYKFNVIGGFKIDTLRCGYSGEFCAVRDVETEKFGFINYSGKLVIPCTLYDVRPFTKDGFAWAKDKDANGVEREIFIDERGRKYPIKHKVPINPKILDAYSVYTNASTEFYSKTGRLILRTKRKVSGYLSDGLIRVDSTFDLIGTKSGFMDTTGKMVIPYQFRTSGPNLWNFHDGLVLYRPLMTEDAQYIYYNKAGKPEIKLKRSELIRSFSAHATGTGDFNRGIAHWDINDKPAFLTKDKIAIILPDYIERNNPKFSESYLTFKVFSGSFRGNYRENMNLVFSSNITYKVSTTMTTGGFGTPKTISKQTGVSFTGWGVVDLIGNIIIAPLFEEIECYSYYAGLSKATFRDHKSRMLTKGYVNSDGVFKIVTSKQLF
jgi:hypothetical protein